MLKVSKYTEGRSSFNGRTTVCGTVNQGSIPCDRPSGYLQKQPFPGLFFYEYLATVSLKTTEFHT